MNIDDAPFNTHAEQRRLVYEFKKERQRNAKLSELLKVAVYQLKEYSDNKDITGRNGEWYSIRDIEQFIEGN